jgi:SAM-dependent methyltransferase
MIAGRATAHAVAAALLYGRLLATAAQQVLGVDLSPVAVALARRRGAATYRTRLRIEAHGVVSEWFRWARVGIDGIEPLAERAGIPVESAFSVSRRWLACLRA